MKSNGVTIQMKPLKQYYHMGLFIFTCKYFTKWKLGLVGWICILENLGSKRDKSKKSKIAWIYIIINSSNASSQFCYISLPSAVYNLINSDEFQLRFNVTNNQGNTCKAFKKLTSSAVSFSGNMHLYFSLSLVIITIVSLLLDNSSSF